jgi:hypothetical protein
MRKSMTSQIHACRLGVFPMRVEEDEDESPHVNTDETDGAGHMSVKGTTKNLSPT